jgi:hypothetical protein
MKAFAWTTSALIFSASGAIFLTQCSDSSGDASTADAGSGTCPADPPSIGSACSLSVATQCSSYPTADGGCPTVYVCADGTWSGVGNSAGAPICPATVPAPGSSCTVAICASVGFECPFTCDNGQSVTAICESGQWTGTFACTVVDSGIADSGIEDSGADATDAADGG